MTRELEIRKDAVKEKVTKHDESRGTIPAHKGLCSDNAQSLINDKDLKTYCLNVLTTFRKAAFTLAEVLITLAVIGIVAAMTIPNLVSSYEEHARFTQFKKMYANLSNVWKMSIADMGYYPQCYYWGSGQSPYNFGATCEGNYNEEGNCIGYRQSGKEIGAEDSSLPGDFNGKFANCSEFANAIKKNLKIIKECKGNAYSRGCIPDYPGNDTIAEENWTGEEEMTQYDKNKATAGESGFRKNSIKNISTAYVLADGSIIISYGASFSPSIFAIDVNGRKGPNKWGYDLFDMRTKSAKDFSPVLTGASRTQKGGKSAYTLIEKIKKGDK